MKTKYNMKYFGGLFLALLLPLSISAQKTVQMSAVRANDYGVVYSLPKTIVEVKSHYTKTTRKTGEFYQYAQRYLNISDPIMKDEVVFSLDDIEATTRGVVNKDLSYQVEFRVKSTAPFVTLSKDGLICAINDNYTFPETAVVEKPVVKKTVLSDPYSYLSEEILRAGSTAKQAELIAKQIYRLRESRNEILTGEADNMPPDGDAYKLIITQLDEQEKSLTSLFVGTVSTETLSHEMMLTPSQSDIKEKVIFRFSNKLGIVDELDLAGAPVFLSLTNKEPKTPPVLTEKELKDKEKKFSQGIIFNIPSKASLEVTYNNKKYVQLDCSVAQFGEQDVLISKMFENGKEPIKVIFYPDLGSIKQIIQ